MKGICWFILSGIFFSVVTESFCGLLHPYYLHFPPPAIYPVFGNRIDSVRDNNNADRSRSRSYDDSYDLYKYSNINKHHNYHHHNKQYRINDYPPQHHHGGWTYNPYPFVSIPNSNSTTLSRRSNSNGNSFPSGPIPLVVHTWVNPDKSEVLKLQNGTVIYFVGGPGGGIRANTPSSSTTEKTRPSNKPLTGGIEEDIQSNSIDDDFTPNREALLQRLPQQQVVHEGGSGSGGGYSNLGWSVPIVELPPSSQNAAGTWGQGQTGALEITTTTSTQFNQLPDITTSAPPTRNQYFITISSSAAPSTTSRSNNNLSSTVPIRNLSTAAAAELEETTTTTEDPVAANTNARFPVSPSVRKFRRIVAQFRAITKKELRDAAAQAQVKAPK